MGSRGFTLVEVLMVTILLGVFAAAAIPRLFLKAPSAETAEAIQMLGAVRRMTMNLIDANYPVPNFDTATAMGSGSAWEQIGLGPLPPNRRFDYKRSGNSAVAARVGGTSNQTITLNLNTGVLSCGSDYRAITDGGMTAGCE